MAPKDEILLSQLRDSALERKKAENHLYIRHHYLIPEAMGMYQLSREDSFHAYTEALISLFNDTATGRIDESKPIKATLYQLLCRKCVDLLRQAHMTKPAVRHTDRVADLWQQLPDKAREIVEAWLEGERLVLIKLDLERLGERCREMLMLFEEGYSDKNLAETMGYQNATVARTSRFACFEKLKALVMARKHIDERKL